MSIDSIDDRRWPFFIHGENTNTPQIYISEEILSPDCYYPLYAFFRAGQPHQTYHMYINSPGGELGTTCQILSAMFQCEAEIVGHLDYEAASAAGVLLLGCDTWEVSPFSIFMAHADTGGYFGKRQEAMAQYGFSRPWVDSWLETVYSGFLTPKEINLLLEGKDYYFGYEEICERLRKLMKYRDKILKGGRRQVVEEQ